MKKVVLCLSVGLVLLTLNADSVLTNRAEDVFADLMANTTNYWGRDVVAFREAARSGMTMLRLAESRSGEPYRMSWLTTLLGLKAPTNTCEVYRTWLDERGKWMYGLIGGFQTASCTNLWFAVADELRCLRYGIPSEESIMNRYRNELLSAAPGEVLVSSGMPEGFYNEMDMRTARMDAASTMVSLVVDCYGCRGLPLLSEDVRLVVFSNLVQRAGLTEGEAARLRRNAKLPEQTREAVLFEELMNQTTNSWCINSEAFSAAVNTNMLELSRIGTPSAKAYGRRWLLALADLPVSTNSHHVYCTWIAKKTRCLFGAGRRYLDVDSTNLWMSVAMELGRIKSSQTTESAIEAKYMTVQEESPGNILVSGFPQDYYDEIEKLGAERESASRLQSLIIDWVGRRGLPQLPDEDRCRICSVLEANARLTESEAMQLRHNANLADK